MIRERLEAQKVKDELLYMIKDYVIHNMPLNKNALLNSLTSVGFTYRVFESDREIFIREDSKAVLRIDFIYINEHDIKLVFMRSFNSFILSRSKLAYWYYKKFNCYNKELYGEVQNEIKRR